MKKINRLKLLASGKSYLSGICLFIMPLFVRGYWVAAAGVGAEIGYVAAQDERTIGETVGDQIITTKIKSKLVADKEVSGLNLSVDSNKGYVTLKGFVDSVYEARKAIELAASVSGVKYIASKIIVDSD